MVKLDKISNLGLGMYRMTTSCSSHFEALDYAIKIGINLLDSASNYKAGKSEELIGRLSDGQTKRESIFITSKAGYIQGKDLGTFSNLIDKNKAIKINSSFFYSFDRLFLEKQLYASMKRMKIDYIDGYLIHNPEYFIKHSRNTEKAYNKLIESLYFLEGLSQKGVIRYYGISSNVLPKGELDINKIISHLDNLPNFKFLQFPFNLIENQALSEFNGYENLFHLCKTFGIKTLANRPLNTSYEQKAIRLADYSEELLSIDFGKEKKLFISFLKIISDHLQAHGENNNLSNYYPLNFLIENRKNIANPEAVELAINKQLIPFLKELHFESNNVFNLLSELKQYWILYSKKNISHRIETLKKELHRNQIILKNDNRNLSIIACESYLNSGVDHVLVGMRKKKYIKQLSGLL